MSNNETKIIVIYVGVYGVREEDISTYVERVTSRISPKSINAEIIVIPTQSTETRIDCINPLYIKDDFLINKHEFLMKELHRNLEEQIKYLNDEKKDSRN